MTGETQDPEVLQRRAGWGVVAMGARTVVMQLTVFGGNIVLARVLEPADFGVFAIVQFALAFFAFFGDAGLGAALVQKKTLPGKRELSSVFWVQVLLTSALLILVSLLADGVHLIWSGLPDGTAWLLRALSLAMLATVLRVIPTILMERELLFGRLSVLDVLNTLVFFGVAVVLALRGWGTWALVGGVLSQAVVVTAAAYLMRPWAPQLALDKEALRPMIRFGLPFQAKNIIGFLNGAIAPLYAGAMLGKQRLGYITWAQSTAYFPLKLVEIMGRVTFPFFSRFQNDRAMLSEYLGRAVMLCATATLFFVGLIYGIGEPLVLIVYTDKWLPALPLLYIYVGAISLGFLAPLVASAFDALGKPQVFLKLSIAWTALAWGVVVFTTPVWGMVGFVAGFCVHVVVGNIVVIFVLRRLIPEARIWPAVRAALVGAVAIGLLGHFVVAEHVAGWLTLLGAIVGATLLFAGIVVALDYQHLRRSVTLIRRKAAPPQSSGTSPVESGKS